MSHRLQYLTMGIASTLAYTLYPNGKDQNHLEMKITEKSTKDSYSNSISRSTELLQHIKLKYGLPCLAISVSVNGSIMWREGLGYSDVENLVECKPNTVFRIGSISKPLTAAVVGKLLQGGHLSLDDDISKYNIDWPTKFVDGKKCRITCRHLMSHSSGIRHYNLPTSELNEVHIKHCYKDVTSALSLFKNDPLLFTPGSKTHYSTFAWTLVAAICESVSNMSFSALLHQLFEDLSMNNTFLDNHNPLILHRTRYYTIDSHNQLVNSPYAESTHKYAGGGILSTVEDITLFANAMLKSFQTTSDQVGYLSGETVRELWSHNFENNKSFGLGWFISNKTDHPMYVYHTGCSVGGSSVVLIQPTDDTSLTHGVVVCIMTNVDGVNLLSTAKMIALDFAA